ncbi:MAG: DUF1353 domain-containing protein [Dehalococcoidia bacterium]|jgi:hypothetical protein
MSEFLTDLDIHEIDDDCVWELDKALVYLSDLIGKITVPNGFQTDFASVPRVPIAYMFFGNKAHRESVIHDFLYRADSVPLVSRELADNIFFEAMECRGKGCGVRYPMWWGVRLGGWTAYHKKRVVDRLID